MAKKSRSSAEKYGRYKWIEKLQKRILDRVDRIEKRQRLILKGLQHQFIFAEDYVVDTIAKTRLDHAILDVLREAGPRGVLPSKIAYRLRTYGADRIKISRHIKAMNRRLQRELGYGVAEKVGHKWALTEFMDEVWGMTQEELTESEETNQKTYQPL